MVFLGQTEEIDSVLLFVRMPDLIRDDKLRGWEKFMALKMGRLYLKKKEYDMN